MGLYYNGKKVRNLYYNGKCIMRLALGKEMTKLVEGDDFVRADWLVAQTTSKVTMMALPLSTSDFKYSIRLLDRVPNLSYFTTGWHAYGVSNTQTLVFIYDRKNSTTVYQCQTGFQLGDTIMIDSTAEDLLFNNISIPKYGFPAQNFIIQTNNNVALNMRISSIYVDGVERYIPCRLLRPIPAALDANGIARNAGECGMLDSISGKFYGNVGSGAFTVEPSLVEGVDYERHRWLKTGSGNPYIQVDDTCNTDANAYIETTYKCNYSNGGFDMAVGFSVNQNNNIGIRIFNTANGTFVDYHKTENGVLSSYRVFKTQSSINAERHIKATLNNLIIDTTEYPTINWGSGFDSVNYPNTRLLTNSDNNDVRFKRTKIRVNFKEFDLVPVRLLRPLPAYLDANGKARTQYECGMVDLKTMKFYGNVDTTGNFTVSDN